MTWLKIAGQLLELSCQFYKPMTHLKVICESHLH